MPRYRLIFGLALAVLAAPYCESARGQQVQLTAPYHILNDSYYENFGTGFSLNNRGRNWFFNTGPATSARPPFGGYDPGADASFGIGGVLGGGTRFGFNWLGSQGSNRSHVMEAPTIVIPNGGTGSLFSGSIRPFVTGVVPVVGNSPMGPMVPVMTPQTSVSPLQERLERLRQQEALAAAQVPGADPVGQVPRGDDDPIRDRQFRDDAPLVLGGGQAAGVPAAERLASGPPVDSTANHGDISVAEIRRRQALEEAAREQEILIKIEKARGYEDAGKPGVAKIYYQQAAAEADGELKQKLLAKIRSLTP
jgi:hypothetical protein